MTAKLNDSDKRMIVTMYAYKFRISEIAQKFNVNRRTISAVVNNFILE